MWLVVVCCCFVVVVVVVVVGYGWLVVVGVFFVAVMKGNLYSKQRDHRYVFDSTCLSHDCSSTSLGNFSQRVLFEHV